MGNRTCSLA